MPRWTPLEDYRLITAHECGCPSREDLAAMFSRHSVRAIIARGWGLGITRREGAVYWLRLAHLYFARREAEMSRALW